MTIVLLHGIQLDLSPTWWQDWIDLLPILRSGFPPVYSPGANLAPREHTGGHDSPREHTGGSIHPITWEPLEDARLAAARLTGWRRWPLLRRFYDLAGDLAAVLDPSIHCYILAELNRAAWLSDGLIVISHSLGTVLAHQALESLSLERTSASTTQQLNNSTTQQLNVRLWVTFGSPLWRADQFPGLLPRVQKPSCVRRWVNVYSPLDFCVGRRPIAAADVNLRAWCTHNSRRYLRSRPFRDQVTAELAAAL